MAATGTYTATGATRQRYTPYGALRGQTSLTLPTQHAWLDQTSDPNTGLTYLNNRYYDPAASRFLAPDPLIAPDTPAALNPYTYANDNPTTHTDPTGLYVPNDVNVPDPDCPTGFCTTPPPSGGSRSSGGSSSSGTPTGTQTGHSNSGSHWWNSGWVSVAAPIVAGVVAGGLTTAGCLALTGGTGSAACVYAGYAAGGAASSALSYELDTPSDDKTTLGLAGATVTGGIIGAATGGLLGKAGGALSKLAGKEVADSGGSLFRGVNAGHPKLTQALAGRADPLGGHADAALHNAGNAHSVFTSWSSDPGIAYDAAMEYGSGGVVLRIPAREQLLRTYGRRLKRRAEIAIFPRGTEEFVKRLATEEEVDPIVVVAREGDAGNVYFFCDATVSWMVGCVTTIPSSSAE